MAKINISERDFDTIAAAAWLAKDVGNNTAAAELDKIARKMNASLSRTTLPPLARNASSKQSLTWLDVPSVFDLGEAAKEGE